MSIFESFKPTPELKLELRVKDVMNEYDFGSRALSDVESRLDTAEKVFRGMGESGDKLQNSLRAEAENLGGKSRASQVRRAA